MIARPGQAARIAAFDRDAGLAGQPHALDAQAALVDARREFQRLQARERARVDRVAAQFVARKDGAIDDAHARAGTRQKRAGDRSRRPGADNQKSSIG